MDDTVLLALIGGGTAAAVSGLFTLLMFALQRRAARRDRREDQAARIGALERGRDEINEELGLLTYGILACLKGLREKGCNGPVTDAVGRIEKHLNEKAHGG